MLVRAKRGSAAAFSCSQYSYIGGHILITS